MPSWNEDDLDEIMNQMRDTEMRHFEIWQKIVEYGLAAAIAIFVIAIGIIASGGP